MQRNHKPENPEEQLLESTLLLDVYGELLTERQRQFMRLHFEEDLSFSAIARESEISRQAVYDSVKHAVQSLQHFERTLRLVHRTREEQLAPMRAEPHLAGRQLVERLQTLRARIDKAETRDGLHWVKQELDTLIGLLQGNL